MVIDRLENIEKYTLLHPLFEQAIDFLKSHDLHSLEIGKTELKGKDLLVNVAQTNPKKKKSQTGNPKRLYCHSNTIVRYGDNGLYRRPRLPSG